MPSTARRLGATLAATTVLSAGLVAGATAASAKSDLGLGVRSHTVARGGTIQLRAFGNSDDFGGTRMQLCIDQRVAKGAWRQLRCASATHLVLNLRATHRGTVEFRAQLVGVVGGHQGRRVDRTSGTVVVHVR